MGGWVDRAWLTIDLLGLVGRGLKNATFGGRLLGFSLRGCASTRPAEQGLQYRDAWLDGSLSELFVLDWCGFELPSSILSSSFSYTLPRGRLHVRDLRGPHTQRSTDAQTMCGLGQLAAENFVIRSMVVLVTPLFSVEEVELP